MKIFHLNISSLNRNFDKLCLFLSSIDVEFEIIILTETFKHDNFEKSPFAIKNYSMLYNHGDYNKNDGVVVYIRSDLQFNYNVVLLGSIKVLEILVSYKSKQVLITGLYKSPQIEKESFNDSLMTYLDKCKKHKTHLLVGDININLLNRTEESVENYKNILAQYQFKSYINKVTRPRSGTCLDHIFFKGPSTLLDSSKSFIFQTHITDHYPVAFFTSFSRSEDSKSPKQTQTKRFTNYTHLKRDLKMETWDQVYTMNDVNESMKLFINKLQFYLEKNTKVVNIQQNKNCFRKEWMNSNLQQISQEKNKLYTELIKDPNDLNLKNRYNACKNKLRTQIKASKKQYFQTQVNLNATSKSNLWDCINQICTKTKPRTKIGQIKSPSGNTYTEKHDISNEFNNFYSDLGGNLAKKIKQIPNYKSNIPCLQNSMLLRDVSIFEVNKTIMNLKIKKSPGWDNIKVNV